MKLVCPKCLSHLKVPSDRMPVNGGWARCPKCAERFYVRAPGKGPDLLSDNPPTPPARKRSGRDEASQRLLDRVRAQTGREVRDSRGFDPDLSSVTIFPEPALSPAVCQAIGIALLALPLVVLAAIFFKSEPASPPPTSTAEFTTMLNDEFNADLIRSDLLRIKQKTVNRNRLLMQVDFTGSESRVFKYFASNLAPGVCDVISWLDIESDKPALGFEATAVCVGGVLERLRMQVNWTGRTATISFPGYSARDMEVDLFPVKPRADDHDVQGG